MEESNRVFFAINDIFLGFSGSKLNNLGFHWALLGQQHCMQKCKWHEVSMNEAHNEIDAVEFNAHIVIVGMFERL